MVSAWATENRLTLGQVAVPDGSNEIGVIPELLRTLDLAGAIVTIDAAGCQIENARLIRGQGGHYLLAVKGNQPTLQAAVERGVRGGAARPEFAGCGATAHATTEDGHGRHEERYVDGDLRPGRAPGRSGRTWRRWCQVSREREVGGERTAPPTTT